MLIIFKNHVVLTKVGVFSLYIGVQIGSEALDQQSKICIRLFPLVKMVKDKANFQHIHVIFVELYRLIFKVMVHGHNTFLAVLIQLLEMLREGICWIRVGGQCQRGSDDGSRAP